MEPVDKPEDAERVSNLGLQLSSYRTWCKSPHPAVSH